jgi:NAD(P)-dependent dehydrogenase (short-subunit alcohol dehydrogenase family)
MGRKHKDRIVVVTGASSGIGRATALQLAAGGATVVVNARGKEALESVVADCEQAGGRAVAMAGDVADSRGMEAIAAETVGNFGRLDAWVNNAAVNLFGRFEELPLDEFHRVAETNFFGTVHGARAAIPWFREQGHGVLVNVASVLSKVGSPFQSAYAASKFAIRGLSESLRQELEDVPDISVVTVLPGAIDTPLFSHAGNYMGRQVVAPRPTIDVERVADGITAAIARPRREVVIGGSTRLDLLTSRLAPGLTEKASARLMASEQFSDEPAAPTSGNVFEPVPYGTGTEGGWRAERRWSWKLGLALGAAVATGAVLRNRRPS